MSRVVSLRVPDQQMERLSRLARRMGKSPGEAGALLVEEGLRRTEFAFIDFRDSVVGRQAYIQGSGLAVWEVVMVAQDFGLDAGKTAEHLGWPLAKVRAALLYWEAFPEEINQAIADNDAMDFTTLSRLIPTAELIRVSGEKP